MNKDIFQNIIDWQNRIGLVPQENYLLDDTILNNIIFDDKKDIDNIKLENAMYYSGVSQFINQLNEGLNTVVGEKKDLRFLGGQIQRIALARVLYQDPDVLILDEFTNSLDPENEDFILNNYNYLKKKKIKIFLL